MANYRAENILVGAAAIYLNSTPPDGNSPADKSALDTAPWQSTGYTTGGVEVTYTPDFGEVEVDQLLDAAVMFKQRMTVSIGTTLAEATLENLIFAWGQDTDTISPDSPVNYESPSTFVTRTLTVESGALGDRPLERQVALVGQAPGGWDHRLYHFHRCLNVESSAFSLSRADATGIPVSLRCLPFGDEGEYGTVTDVVAP